MQLRASVRVHADWRTTMPDRLLSQPGPPLVPHAKQPHADLWPLASHGVLILPSASGSTAVVAEGGILGPQLGSSVPAGPLRKPSSREPEAWHWCSWTAAEGEGSRRCYLWGNANKWFKNVWHPCQIFISCCHSNRFALAAWLVVKIERKKKKKVTLLLLFYLLLFTHTFTFQWFWWPVTKCFVGAAYYRHI